MNFLPSEIVTAIPLSQKIHWRIKFLRDHLTYWVESTTGAVTVGKGESLLPAVFTLSRCLNPTLVPFPVAARRTGRADLPHPALGRGVMPSPTEGCVYAPAVVQAPELRIGTHRSSVLYPDRTACVSYTATDEAGISRADPPLGRPY